MNSAKRKLSRRKQSNLKFCFVFEELKDSNWHCRFSLQTWERLEVGKLGNFGQTNLGWIKSKNKTVSKPQSESQ